MFEKKKKKRSLGTIWSEPRQNEDHPLSNNSFPLFLFLSIFIFIVFYVSTEHGFFFFFLMLMQ